MNLGEMIRDELKNNPITEEERLERVKEGELERIALKKENNKNLKFKNLDFFTKNVKKAKKYNKQDFLNDITNRSIGVLSIYNSDKFKEILSSAYDEMSKNSEVLLLDKYVLAFTMSGLRDIYTHRYYNKKYIEDIDDDKLYEMSELVNDISLKFDKIIHKSMTHRIVLQKILMKKFKNFKFKLSETETEWTGLEFPTAAIGGFEERTSFDNLNYDIEEHGHSLKELYFCALAVYFIEIRRIKQVYVYKKMFLKETTKFDKETLLNIEKGLSELKNLSYE